MQLQTRISWITIQVAKLLCFIKDSTVVSRVMFELRYTYTIMDIRFRCLSSANTERHLTSNLEYTVPDHHDNSCKALLTSAQYAPRQY